MTDPRDGQERFEQLKGEALALLDDAIAAASRWAGPTADTTAGALSVERTRLAAGRLFVVVVGEFKRGKSTLLNALVGEPELFPTATAVTTSVVTTLAYGPARRVVVHTGDPEVERATATEVDHSELRDYVTETSNPNNARNVRLVEIELPSHRLREGLVLVDTPGIGTENTAHTEATNAFLPSADAILFVADAVEVLRLEELRFLRQIAERTNEIIVVMTKADLAASPEQLAHARDNLAAKIAETLDEDLGPVPEIIPVSATSWLDHLGGGSERAAAASNFPTLERAIWDRLATRRGQILMLRALNAAARELDGLAAPVEAELEVYEAESAEARARLEADAAAASGRLEALRQSGAPWRAVLVRQVGEVPLAARETLGRGMEDLRAALEELAADDSALDNPETIADVLKAGYALLAGDVDATLAARSGEAYDAVVAATGLRLDRYSPALGSDEAPDLELAPVRHVTGGRRAWRNTRAAVYGTSIGATVGGLLGAAVGSLAFGVGAVPGAMWGAAIGSIFGPGVNLADSLKSLRHTDRRETKVAVQRACQSWLVTVEKRIGLGIDRATKAVREAIEDEFEDAIGRERTRASESLAGVRRALTSEAAEATRRRAELEAPRREVRTLMARADALALAVTGQRPEGGFRPDDRAA